MHIVAWNVNSIRAITKKGNLQKFLDQYDPDILCVGETKLSCPDEKECEKLSKIGDYPYRYYNTSKIKNGYSGTMVWSKVKPIGVSSGLVKPTKKIKQGVDPEGRVITLEFKSFYLIHTYVPNSGEVLQRLDYRTQEWDVAFQKYLKSLQKKKPIIVCGDLNCAHQEIDIHNPKGNLRSAGFTVEERESFDKYMNLKLIDVFREKNPKLIKYTYWSYRGRARPKNKGWRIDYFLVDKKLSSSVVSNDILDKVEGSDHAPVEIILNNSLF